MGDGHLERGELVRVRVRVRIRVRVRVRVRVSPIPSPSPNPNPNPNSNPNPNPNLLAEEGGRHVLGRARGRQLRRVMAEQLPGRAEQRRGRRQPGQLRQAQVDRVVPRLQPYVREGCNRMCEGCHRMRWRLQPYVMVGGMVARGGGAW